MNYTLKTLSRRIASDSSDEAVATAARRVEHWVSAGLFDIAWVDIGPKAMGRGRVRKYPEEALPWCLLWTWMADHGLGPVIMASVATTIRGRLLIKSPERKWLLQAMRGEGPALFLHSEFMSDEQGVPQGPRRQSKVKFSRSPIRFADDWSGGLTINLTRIYARAAGE